MRILIVGFTESIHLARAVGLIADQGWDLHVFPSSFRARPHPELRGVTVYVDPTVSVPERPGQRIQRLQHPLLDVELPFVGQAALGWEARARVLASLIDYLRPDVLHSHELQHGGYLTLDARSLVSSPFPPWMHSNWGSDLNWFGRHPHHVERIKRVLSACDVYACDCHRDAGLARAFGFRGLALPVMPIPGGFDLHHLATLRSTGPTSARRTIALKGTLFTFGRADVALAALECCGDLLGGYELAVYLAGEEILSRAERLGAECGLEITVLSAQQTDERPYDELLAMHGRARVSIALNASDGLSVSFLEALVMGSYPIQSWTGCAGEWVRPGVSGALVPPADVARVAASLRRALTDDELVDRAAAINRRTAAAHLDRSVIALRMADAYERVALQKKVFK